MILRFGGEQVKNVRQYLGCTDSSLCDICSHADMYDCICNVGGVRLQPF